MIAIVPVADPTVWTMDDYTAVKAAVLALATGSAVQTITFAGPPQRTVTYQQQNLPQLRALLAEIAREVNSTQNYRRASFNKGFRNGDCR